MTWHFPGLLIYAAGERKPASYRVRYAGKTLDVIGLDLDAEPEDVLAQIREVARRVRELRVRALEQQVA
jgi:hypothetical protein